MAPSGTEIRFGSYRLDPDAARLWKGHQRVPLQPRPLAVLAYLAARPEVVVGREELVARVWAGVHEDDPDTPLAGTARPSGTLLRAYPTSDSTLDPGLGL